MAAAKRQFKSILVAFTLCFLIIGIACLSSCKKEYVTNVTVVQPLPDTTQTVFTQFSFGAANNALYINDSLSLEIEGNAITGRIPYYTNVKALAASFATNLDSAIVTVNGVVQESGITKQDFTQPVNYVVTDKYGKATNYMVALVNFTGLPVIKITTKNSAPIVSKDDYVKGHVSLDGAGFYADIEADMKIKGHGNSTWNLPKKPFKIKFDDKQPVFGEPADKEWILLANYFDKSSLRNTTALYMGQLSNLEWTPHSHFAEVFLNDVYMGTYEVAQSVAVTETKVNVPEDDGFLLEVDQKGNLEAEDVYFETPHMLVNIKEPELTMDDSKYTYIKDYVTTAENTLLGSNFTDPVNGYAKYLDVPSFVDWYLINEITKNNDAVFYSSCYMTLAPGGKLKMGPIWDFDLSLGNVTYNTNYNTDGFWVMNAPWIKRLFEDPAFVSKVKERFTYFKAQQNLLLNKINNNASLLKWSIIENNNKWKTLYANIAPNYEIWGSYDNEVIYLKNWLNARLTWLQNAFDAM